MQGGLAFRLLERTVGWKVAKRVKAFAHRHGFSYVSRLKAKLWRRGGEWR
jgi:hypothetical protein